MSSMSEKTFEVAVKTAIKGNWPSGRCVKIASAWLGGVLDVYLKLPHRPAAWIELKFVDVSSRKSEPESVPLSLSGQQRQWIRNEKRAGGVAGWLILVRLTEFETVMLSGYDPDCRDISYHDLIQNGVRGRLYKRSKDQWAKLLGVIYDQP